MGTNVEKLCWKLYMYTYLKNYTCIWNNPSKTSQLLSWDLISSWRTTRLLLKFSLVFALKNYIWHRDKTWLFMFVRHCMSSGLPSWEAKDEQFFNRTRVLVHQTSTLATLQLVSSPDPQCGTHTGLAGSETPLQQVAFLSCAVIQSCYRL